MENLKTPFQVRNRVLTSFLVLVASVHMGSSVAHAEATPTGAQYLRDAAQLYQSGMYFKSARYAFAAFETQPSLRPDAYAWVTMGLMHAGLPNAASYFFIRTLQSGSPAAIRSVLSQTQELMMTVGSDILRKYLIRHTKYENYDSMNRSAYLYALAKDLIVSGDPGKAIGYLSNIDRSSPLWPYSLHLRGSAYALTGRDSDAIEDFRKCASVADKVISSSLKDVHRIRLAEREADDLEARCIVGEARTLYQMEQFDDADRVYDEIPKKSIVWPDILFEQAWNAFARRQYNRSLGKLVSYKSPALEFMFNTEIEVLAAQSYLMMCLYSDANDVVNDFNSKYVRVGEEVKSFVEHNQSDLSAFYQQGKAALRAPRYTKNAFYRMSNRFVRGPYFQNLVSNEAQISREREMIRRFDQTQTGVNHHPDHGFPGFLQQVIQWRGKTIQLLGGAFVKNSLIDYHAALIDDFEKMAFIKLEMLKFAKEKLLYKSKPVASSSSRNRGSVEPTRRNDQMKWEFNEEFWNDELGDYVFGLESECKS
jgi:tetratricopeptide (TPR) repeat protein